MEELRHFRSEESRQRALDSLAGSVRPRDIALGIVIMAAAGALGFLGAGLLLRYAPFPVHRVVVEIVRPVAAVALILLTLRRLHRIDAGKALRRMLVEDGVPVCLRCGYLLHGLPATSPGCPECGQRLSEPARELLQTQGPTVV